MGWRILSRPELEIYDFRVLSLPDGLTLNPKVSRHLHEVINVKLLLSKFTELKYHESFYDWERVQKISWYTKVCWEKEAFQKHLSDSLK